MATETDISNLALSHFGQDASIDSIDPPDGSVEAALRDRVACAAVQGWETLWGTNNVFLG